MNKYKKIAAMVVSTVMAGTMALTFTACGPGDDNLDDNNNRDDANAGITDVTKLPDLYDVVDDNGNVKYSTYQSRGNVTLHTAIEHNNAQTQTSFKSLGATITLPDGKSYGDDDMKPAWTAMGTDLNITWDDQAGGQGHGTSDNLAKLIESGKFNTTDILTTDLSKAAGQSQRLLDLGQYLDYMPHYRAFLESYPIVYLSLLRSTFDTETGEGRSILIAPYFDGFNDIERYCLMRQDWVEKILNGNETLADSASFATACSTATHATAYMQQTGTLPVESLNATGTEKITIVKNYDAVVNALKATTDNALKTAYNAIANAAYAGNSGNIVDVMNAALEANSNATGAQLVALFRAYVDTCYQTEAGAPYFTASTRANLFNGYDACWDVDDLVAMLRCVMTNTQALGGGNTVYGIVPRTGQNNRTPTMVMLAGQLYGVRGAASQNEYSYIDNSGNLQDARLDQKFTEAFDNMHALKQENLIPSYEAGNTLNLDGGMKSNASQQPFMMFDYVQSQTKFGYNAEDSSLDSAVVIPEGYNFAPVMTPVAKWDVDGDGNYTDVMRFTESWRSVKTSGIALNGNLANAGNEDRLKAALQFIDYLYSADGQIVSTFGPRATSADGTGGFWYDTEATQTQIDNGAYYTFKGVKYSGYDYKGKAVPTITDKLYDSFVGKEVNGWSLKASGISGISDIAGKFTDYARKLIGSTLPLGVKDQGFESQLTAKMGQIGANKVSVALSDKFQTIKGLKLNLDSNNWWYTCVPTQLPVNSNRQTQLDANFAHYMAVTGQKKSGGNDNFFSIYNYLIQAGYGGTYSYQQETVDLATNNNAQKLTEYLTGGNVNGQGRENIYNAAWGVSKAQWAYLSGHSSQN